MSFTVTVANKYHPGAAGEDITRTSRSPLGNPYSHKEGTRAQFKVATRDEAVAAYRPWLKAEMKKGGAVWAELSRLAELARKGDLVLLCVCKPLSCHGDVVRDAVLFLVANPDWRPTPPAPKPAPRRP